VRDYVADVEAHLAHARLAGDYSMPVEQAAWALTKANDAMNTSTTGMQGGNMGNMGTNMN
jgi:hypothetical protein